MGLPKKWTCIACDGSAFFPAHRCFMCGSYLDAMHKLTEHSISPSEIHQLLVGQKEYHGITMYVANIVIEVLKTSCSEPH